MRTFSDMSNSIDYNLSKLVEIANREASQELIEQLGRLEEIIRELRATYR